MVMAQKVRQWRWNGARNESVHALKGGVGSKKIVFLYERSHQLVENKGRRVQNEAKNEAKIDLNEAKLEAKRSKNSALWAKRSEACEPSGKALTGTKCRLHRLWIFHFPFSSSHFPVLFATEWTLHPTRPPAVDVTPHPSRFPMKCSGTARHPLPMGEG